MPHPDRTPERVEEELVNLLGTGESPPGSNCNPISHRFGICAAWCDMTVFTAWFNAGFNDGKGNFQMDGIHTDYAIGDAYVPNTMRHFQAAGRFSKIPVMGAGEIHFWGGGEQNSHIAAYIKDYGDGTHLNIEGNHNNVCEYVRRRNDDPTIKGYCIPAYRPSLPSHPVLSKEDKPMRLYSFQGGTYVTDMFWRMRVISPGAADLGYWEPRVVEKMGEVTPDFHKNLKDADALFAKLGI